ncbi:mannose-1-phosphate guanylyltransferase/mannose-6-phosphate isomerase [Marinomonas sp. THO17]|uniref:mannose-1-phosphate guanylyltransferase/mannose-6-phosphate isomerase n=1 Tax=Marinomonas sp. THO17 TaxID=3149048 RepID=UPI00336BB450
MKIIPILLSGGVGRRLWPLSREALPKQCLPLVDQELSLFQQTLLRTKALEVADPIVVCNEDHRFLIAQQLQAIGVKKSTILLEPEGRNTAPAIALAALEVQQKYPADALMLVLPVDHLMTDTAAFAASVYKATEFANQGALVTFGVSPTRAETGYGYIRSAADHQVIDFVEKPNLASAEAFLAAGNYLWNSGMFLFQANAYLGELSTYQPAIADAVLAAYEERNEDRDFVRIDAQCFAQCPEASIDCAVMELTNKAKVVPYKGDWSDIGAWDAVYEYSVKDAHQNVLCGEVLVKATRNSLIRSESRLVAVVGVDNLVVVETADAVLVMDKNQAQEVKNLLTDWQDDSL